MNSDIRGSIAWAVGLIGLALVATLARKLGLVEGDTVTRIVMGAIGLMLVWYGNRMPKAFVPQASARRVARVGGWVMVLSGIVYAGVWMFAPLPVAVAGGCAAVLSGIAVTFVYCLSLRSKARVI